MDRHCGALTPPLEGGPPPAHHAHQCRHTPAALMIAARTPSAVRYGGTLDQVTYDSHLMPGTELEAAGLLDRYPG